jgi:toxin FitB
MLCDSNIIIYAAEPDDTCCRAYVERAEAAITSISRIEVLDYPGFAKLTEEHRTRLRDIVESLVESQLSEIVIQQAIVLRQQRKMSLGDAIVAGAALAHGMPLVTRNVNDFKHIVGLRLINPFDSA